MTSNSLSMKKYKRQLDLYKSRLSLHFLLSSLTYTLVNYLRDSLDLTRPLSRSTTVSPETWNCLMRPLLRSPIVSPETWNYLSWGLQTHTKNITKKMLDAESLSSLLNKALHQEIQKHSQPIFHVFSPCISLKRTVCFLPTNYVCFLPTDYGILSPQNSKVLIQVLTHVATFKETCLV